MKILGFTLLAGLVAVSAIEQKSHAALICGADHNCIDLDRIDTGSRLFDATLTTTLWPVGLLGDAEMDMNSPETRAMIFTQADMVLNGQGDAINESSNLVRGFAKANNASDEKMAHALKSIEASGADLTSESIRQALK